MGAFYIRIEFHVGKQLFTLKMSGVSDIQQTLKTQNLVFY